MSNEVELYSKLKYFTGGEEVVISGRVQTVADCPYCLKVSSSEDVHSSFGLVFERGTRYGFYCFVCGSARSLAGFGFDIGFDESLAPESVAPSGQRVVQRLPRKPPSWLDSAEDLLSEYCSHEHRYRLWGNYKSVPELAVDKYMLGVGVLPMSRSREERLITPVMNNGKVMWFRGRALNGSSEQKWLASGGVSLVDVPAIFAEQIEPGAKVLIVENMVDAILVNELTSYSAVPTLSVSYWNESWTKQIAEKDPSMVIVAFDADIAGNGPPNRAARDRQILSRVRKMFGKSAELHSVRCIDSGWEVRWLSEDSAGKLRIPTPMGVRRANDLQRYGLNAHLLPWRCGGMDIGKLAQ